MPYIHCRVAYLLLHCVFFMEWHLSVVGWQVYCGIEHLLQAGIYIYISVVGLHICSCMSYLYILACIFCSMAYICCNMPYDELFYKNALSANLRIDVALPMPSSEIIFWKRALHKYVGKICMRIYTHVKSCFPKHNLWTWHCHCKLTFRNGALRVLEKSSSYIYICCRMAYLLLYSLSVISLSFVGGHISYGMTFML